MRIETIRSQLQLGNIPKPIPEHLVFPVTCFITWLSPNHSSPLASDLTIRLWPGCAMNVPASYYLLAPLTNLASDFKHWLTVCSLCLTYDSLTACRWSCKHQLSEISPERAARLSTPHTACSSLTNFSCTFINLRNTAPNKNYWGSGCCCYGDSGGTNSTCQGTIRDIFHFTFI
jgi:hypothetical protein